MHVIDPAASGLRTGHVTNNMATTDRELAANEARRDDDFRSAWERLALARAVAIEVVRYRADHGLTQRALANLLGVKQPQIARMESGEHLPGYDTLVVLSGRLGIEFNLSITPLDHDPTLLNSRMENAWTICHTGDQAVIRLAAVRR